MIKRIGISGSRLLETGKVFNGYPRAYVNQDYIRSISQNGALPIILPVIEKSETTVYKELIIEYVKNIDGLILSGGHDLYPPYFGQECLPKLQDTYPQRDEFDLALYLECVKMNKPVLAICRGFQLIMAYHGAKLYQDLSYSPVPLLSHDQVDNPTEVTHKISVLPNTIYYELWGQEINVNSFHHQFVLDVPEEFVLGAVSGDGVVEAVEHRELSIYGVQFHPEMLSATIPEMNKLFDLFIQKI